MNQELHKLEVRLGYHFRNAELLAEAVTHRSAHSRNNERLEFLGDSVLNFIVADELYQVRCTVDGAGMSTEGEAGSRRQAEQQAAEAMLALLQGERGGQQ